MNRLAWLSVVFAALVVACGGDSATAPTPSATLVAVPDTLPDACTLLDASAAGAAIGTVTATGTAPQPPTDASSRCEWREGQYTLSLLLRQGTIAKSSFDNAVDGFTAATVAGAEARVQLGARETARNYRLVTLSAYDGTYHVYFTLQGPDRDDATATATVTDLAETVFERLE